MNGPPSSSFIEPEDLVDGERLVRLRRERAVEALREARLAALVATRHDNVLYLGEAGEPHHVDGYSPAVAVIAADGDVRFLDINPYVTPGPHWAKPMTPVGEDGWEHFSLIQPSLMPERYAAWIVAALGSLGVRSGTIGIDGAPTPICHSLRAAAPQIELSAADELFQRARSVKNAEELKLLRRAAWIASRGVDAALASLAVDAEIGTVLAAAMSVMFELGQEGSAFTPLCAIGTTTHKQEFPTSAELHSPRRSLRVGDPVIVDLGPTVGGYNGDCMRTGIVGPPSEPFLDLYRANYTVLQAGVEVVRPGIRCSKVDAAVRRAATELGYLDDRFDTGHGIGLVSAELPVCLRAGTADPRLDLVLEPGMVFTIEPRLFKATGAGSYLQSALEESIVVNATGAEVITSAAFLPEAIA